MGSSVRNRVSIVDGRLLSKGSFCKNQKRTRRKKNMIDPSATKYLVKATIMADGIVEKPDIIGAIFGQSEGLLGEELDLRDLQKSGRIGRIEVEVDSQKGKSQGEIFIPSSLDQVETSILAAALETIDRVGPCRADIKVASIEDTRLKKRNFIVDRARELLTKIMEENRDLGTGLMDSVRQSIQEEEITSFGEEKLPAGPNIETSDSIIVVEGRSDILNLLRHGIKNTIAVEGTKVPDTISELSKERTLIAFVDGDRGGELILKELLQVAEVDFIARAPRAREVEELTQKQIVKALRNKIPAEQFVEMYSLDSGDRGNSKSDRRETHKDEKKEDKKQDSKKDWDRKDSKTAKVEERAEEKPAAKKTEEKVLSPEQKAFREKLKSLSGSKRAVLLDDKNQVVAQTQINNIFTAIEENKGKFSAVVMDGVVSQKLVDTVQPIGVKTLVAIRANVTKLPSGIVLWTKDEIW